MLIWIGIVGTLLALIGLVGIAAIVWAVKRLEARAEFEDDGRDVFLESQKARMVHEDQWLRELSGIFAEFSKTSRADGERFLADWKAASGVFTKCEQELADNLAALLREVKVSKAFAQGATALVEQNVAAVDKLWQIVEMIRRGPRTPTNIAPTDAQAAAREHGGDTEEQRLAIESMLASVTNENNDLM